MRYDAAFCLQAALTGNRRWSQINPMLYSICFTGKAQVVARCKLCLSASHSTMQCPLDTDPDPDLPSRVKAVETTLLSLAGPRLQKGRGPLRSRLSAGESCRLWNVSKCRFLHCRFKQVCNSCSEAHPALYCPKAT